MVNLTYRLTAHNGSQLATIGRQFNRQWNHLIYLTQAYTSIHKHNTSTYLPNPNMAKKLIKTYLDELTVN